jgi:predicted PurR-regulated permease PerM
VGRPDVLWIHCIAVNHHRFMRGISIHRANAMLLFAILLAVALYYGHTVLVPLTFGIILAMLLLPVCRKLESWGVGRALSVFLCILCSSSGWRRCSA